MWATNPLSRDFSGRAKTETGVVQEAQTNNQNQDIYTRVTNAIVSAIEAGAGAYKMPWVVRQDCGLSSDKRAIFTAASQAQKDADWFTGKAGQGVSKGVAA